MNYLKILALVSAAAAMTLALSSSAAGTVLCKQSQTTSCSSPYPAGTVVHLTQKTGTSTIWEYAAGTTNLTTCPETTSKFTTSNSGSATETVQGSVVTLTWTSCSNQSVTISNGQVELHHVTSGAPTFTTKGTEVTINGPFGSCVYGAGTGITYGTIASGEPAIVTVNAVFSRIGGSALCPLEARETGTLTVTSPRPLFVSES